MAQTIQHRTQAHKGQTYTSDVDVRKHAQRTAARSSSGVGIVKGAPVASAFTMLRKACTGHRRWMKTYTVPLQSAGLHSCACVPCQQSVCIAHMNACTLCQAQHGTRIIYLSWSTRCTTLSDRQHATELAEAFLGAVLPAQPRMMISAHLSCFRVVLHRYCGALHDATLVQESDELLVASALHSLELFVCPCIHGNAAHKAEVHAKPSMLAAALQAHEAAIGDACPLGVSCLAIAADLQRAFRASTFQCCLCLACNTIRMHAYVVITHRQEQSEQARPAVSSATVTSSPPMH